MPDFVSVIALPFFCAVPIATPVDPKGVRVIPSAGPYHVVSYTPGQGVVLERNPNYHGSRLHRPERIELTVGISQKEAARKVEAGEADYAADGIAPNQISRLVARYGVGSPAAKEGHRQFFVNPAPGVTYLALNMRRPLFRDIRLRKAANLAIDRRALARAGTPARQEAERPTDQYLPPGLPGFVDARIYPFRPAIARARRLAGTKRRSAVLYTCSGSPCDQIAQIAKASLAKIGIDVQVKSFGASARVRALAEGRRALGSGLVRLGGRLPGSCAVPQHGAVGGQAGRSTTRSTRASWRRRRGSPGLLGISLTESSTSTSPAMKRHGSPTRTRQVRDFFSARIGCQVFLPAYSSMDLAALCIRP